MDQLTRKTLEFDQITGMLCERAVSENTKQKLRGLEPGTDPVLCREALRETQDAIGMIGAYGTIPLSVTDGVEELVAGAQKGSMLTAEELERVAMFAAGCRRTQSYLRKCEEGRWELSLNGRAFRPLDDLEGEIGEAIRAGEVADSASNALKDARRRITVCEQEIRMKLSAMIRGHAEWFADGYVAVRGGCQTLPVKASFARQVPGRVIDRSQTGGTVFIEPQAAARKREELEQARIEEENEVRRVLYALSALVADRSDAILEDLGLTERLDYVFARGKLALDQGAVIPELSEQEDTLIVRGIHPLLDRGSAVPLDFGTGSGIRGVIVTGPNTGGKTVALKTVGLFTLMAQCGLAVPASSGTRIRMRSEVLCDIGDGQDITENLSTFSAHMTRVLRILEHASGDSLVLIDELGSGTDPAEGMGLAIAVLEVLISRGCTFLVTTHYPEIKTFAESAPGVINARMKFDPATLKPLYEMEMGRSGESCAILIAGRLGFPEALLRRAEEASAGGISYRGTEMRSDVRGRRLEKHREPERKPSGHAASFGRGDSVRVFPEGKVGIVAVPADEKGELIIQMRGGKRTVNHKRLKLLVPAGELYPEDYDFSIVFDSVANRKARHTMDRKHDPDAVVREET